MPSAARRLRKASPAPREARGLADESQLELTDALANALLRRANDEAERHDRRAAEDFFDQGALLAELCGLTYDDSVLARFVDGPEAAKERIRLARATTRLLAGVYGLARCRMGLALLDHFGLATFDQLEAVDLPVKLPDGRSARFPATRELLAGALESLGLR